jgi:hypothetical protein
MNSIYRGSPYQQGWGQRGMGIGGTFRKYMSWLLPLLRKHALPKIESGLRVVGNTVLTTAGDIAHDVAAGRNVKEAAEERINTAVELLKEKAERTLEGNGIRKKRKFKKFVILKKKAHIKDIFSE